MRMGRPSNYNRVNVELLKITHNTVAPAAPIVPGEAHWTAEEDSYIIRIHLQLFKTPQEAEFFYALTRRGGVTSIDDCYGPDGALALSMVHQWTKNAKYDEFFDTGYIDAANCPKIQEDETIYLNGGGKNLAAVETLDLDAFAVVWIAQKG